MGPPGNGSVVRESVVPTADLVDVPSGDQARARRHADRARRIGADEAGSPGGEPIQVGGLCQRMAVAAGSAAVVLVREYEKEIGRLAKHAIPNEACARANREVRAVTAGSPDSAIPADAAAHFFSAIRRRLSCPDADESDGMRLGRLIGLLAVLAGILAAVG